MGCCAAGDSSLVRLRSGHRLRGLYHDAAVGRAISGCLLGQWSYVVAKLSPGELCTGWAGVCSLLRWNCRLHTLGTEDAVLRAGTIGRHSHRGPNPGVYAVPMISSEAAPPNSSTCILVLARAPVAANRFPDIDCAGHEPPTPLRHGHQVYVFGDVGGACRNICSWKGYSWNVIFAIGGRVQSQRHSAVIVRPDP